METEKEIDNDAAVIIQGITESGGRFRPSDWAERLAGNYARFDLDRRLVYSEDIAPATRDGMVCLVVRGSLARANPSAYAEVMCFARMNQLVCVGLPRGLADKLDATAGRAPAETASIRPSP
jgi:hypothetical protein